MGPRVFLWVFTSLTFTSTAGADLCPREFAVLSKQISILSTGLPQRYQKVVAEATLKHYGHILKGLNEAERSVFVKTIENMKIGSMPPGLETAGGYVEVINGVPIMKFREDIATSPIALVAAIHEAEHLADKIKPTRTLLESPSYTGKIEIRGFLRQHLLLTDIVHQIGVDGIVDLVMHENSVAIEKRPVVESTVRYLLRLGNVRTSSKYADVPKASEWPVEGDDYLKKVATMDMFLGMGDRRRYIGNRISEEPYISKIVQEIEESEKIIELRKKEAELRKQLEGLEKSGVNAPRALGLLMTTILSAALMKSQTAELPTVESSTPVN